MCEVPRRTWRSALRPVRVLLGIAAIAAAGVGAVVAGAVGTTLVAVAAALLLAAVTLPVVREVELGFPSGVRVATAVQDRKEELRNAFADQRQDLSLVANLLCDDPETAAQSLEAAWSRSVAKWRGPVTPELRVFVLCTLVHLLEAQSKWLAVPDPAAHDGSPLSTLPPAQRTVVVLHEFAELSSHQIAVMTGRSVTDVEAALAAAERTLTARDPGGPA